MRIFHVRWRQFAHRSTCLKYGEIAISQICCHFAIYSTMTYNARLCVLLSGKFTFQHNNIMHLFFTILQHHVLIFPSLQYHTFFLLDHPCVACLAYFQWTVWYNVPYWTTKIEDCHHLIDMVSVSIISLPMHWLQSYHLLVTSSPLILDSGHHLLQRFFIVF